jgi:ribosome-binding factor A
MSPRTLKVGEELRRALADIFMRGETHAPELEGFSITVSEVRVSPDLKNATVFVMPLAGKGADKLIPILKPMSAYLRGLVSKKVALRYTPKLRFELDNSFDEAGRINMLLNDPLVKRDIE